MFASLFPKDEKRYRQNNFRHCKLHPLESLCLEYGQKWTKIIYWKIVANEKCTSENGELSSVKGLF